MTAWRDVPTGRDSPPWPRRGGTAAGRLLRASDGDGDHAGHAGATRPAPTRRPPRARPPPVTAGTVATPCRWPRSHCARGRRSPTLHDAEPYTPSAPTGVGTDDYRCFLLDPKLDRGRLPDRDRRAARQPGRRAPRDPVPGAARPGRRRRGRPTPTEKGEGWTCFGGTGVGGSARRWTTRRGSARGRPVAGAGDRKGFGVPLADGHPDRSCRCTTTCSPAPSPTPAPRGSGWLPATAELTPLDDGAAAGPGRAAVPARQDRQAVRPRRRGRGRQGPLRRGPGLAGRPPAPALRRRRHRARADAATARSTRR